MKFSFFLFFFSISWFLLCLYSFALKDLNLTIFDHYVLRSFYENMMQVGYFNRQLSTYIFLTLSIVLIYLYLSIAIHKKLFLTIKSLILTLSFLLVVSLPAQPMFSHDIFNYIFNAKMVLTYHANPHVSVALDFPQDPWLRFMHNVHTAAPYGYGWTTLSLIPYSLSGNSFTAAYLLMKLFISLLFIMEIWAFYKLASQQFDKRNALQRTFLLAFNPLLLIEIFINGHNDSAMMFPVLLSIYLMLQKTTIYKTVFAWILLAFSITTKYASVVLVPLILIRKKVDFFTWGGIALLMVLLTRPGQLHSWYLHWGMVLLLLSKKSWAVNLSLILSLGGLLRYIPYVLLGNWDPPVPFYRWLILLLPLLLLAVNRFKKLLPVYA